MEKKTTLTTIMILFILLLGTNCEIERAEGNPVAVLASNFYVHDNYYFSSPDYIAYLFGSTDHISISNYANYSNRIEIGSYELENSTRLRGYFLNDNLLYLLVDIDESFRYHGIEIVDISNIASPEFICSFFVDELLSSDWYNFPIVDYKTLQFLGNYTFVSTGWGIRIYNFSNIALPSEIGFYRSQGDDYDPPFFAINGDVMYVCNEESLDVVNINNKTNPVLLSKINLGFSAKLQVHNDFLCIGPHKDFPVKFYDITNSTDPKFTADFSVIQNINIADITFFNDSAFFITHNYVGLFDITDINNPNLINDYNFTELIDSLGPEFVYGKFYRGLIDNSRLYLGRLSLLNL